jgi:hypothetical protein
MHFLRTMILLIGAIGIAGAVVDCGSSSNVTGDGSGNKPASGMLVQVSADRDPPYQGDVVLTCSCEVDYPMTATYGDMYVVHGHFNAPPPTFAFVSGDSSWVDTVKVLTTNKHSAVFRAMRRGRYYADVYAYSVLVEGKLTIGGVGSVLLDVK